MEGIINFGYVDDVAWVAKIRMLNFNVYFESVIGDIYICKLYEL